MFVGSAYARDWAYSGGNKKTQYPAVTATTTTDPACVTYNVLRINPYAPDGSANPGVTYQMQYLDPASNTCRTYCLVKNQTFEADTTFPASTSSLSTCTLLNSNANARFNQSSDPRTDRFSMSKGRGGDNGDVDVNLINLPPTPNDTIRPGLTAGHSSDGCIPYGAGIWFGTPQPPAWPSSVYYLGGLMENTTGSPVYYKDRDGTLRRGDFAYNSSASTDGHPGIPNGGLPTAPFPSGINLARPIILNRPLRSVGELGYVGRDLPWKTLDFFTKDSGDAGLLDLFSTSDADVVAGTIDLNTRNAQALSEVLGGGAINPNHVTNTLASPLSKSPGQYPGERADHGHEDLALAIARPNGHHRTRSQHRRDGPDYCRVTAQSAKVQREAAVRTLSEVGNARTWNLLIDIIDQSGRYPQSLGPGASYDSFIPNGEKRYWLHVAIDR